MLLFLLSSFTGQNLDSEKIRSVNKNDASPSELVCVSLDLALFLRGPDFGSCSYITPRRIRFSSCRTEYSIFTKATV